MNESLAELKSRIQIWAQAAGERGLVPDATVESLASLSEQTPANLFDRDERPLVVGFFGGTGVGKSTLLNRLAGERIARTGVERPTSREVTLYLHDTVSVSHLPRDFPLDKIKTATHSNDENRHILWIDMPDFDSSETTNRQQVNNWLPQIDLLIYVVSPERYKDDNGWRLLLEHGDRHAWCFVINHWDRGSAVQREDFIAMLADAGLGKPLLFCTDSSDQPADTSDELNELKATVQSLADNNTIQQLEVRGISVRAGEMKQEVEWAIDHMGTVDNHRALEQYWASQWQQESATLVGSLQWKIQTIAATYQQHESGLLGSVVHAIRGKRDEDTETSTTSLMGTTSLIDEELVSRIDDKLGELIQQAPVHGVPAPGIRQALGNQGSVDTDTWNRTIETQLQNALENPSSPLQRIMHKVFGVLASVLPTLAMGWAGYRIVTAFHAGGATPAAYLSSNFAINALLLVGLSWVLPYFLYRKTRPSRVQAARKGLSLGLETALTQFGDQISKTLQQVRADRDQLATDGLALFSAFPVQTDNTPPPDDKPLSRALLNHN